MVNYSNIKFSTRLKSALDDVVYGTTAMHFWGYLGWHDIRQRYRRSTLGPLWITVSTGVMVAALGTLYSQILKTKIDEYLPFLSIGLITWGLISTVINESCMVFISAEAGIKSTSIPFTAHVLRLVWRNLIVFFHNLFILFIVLMIFPVQLEWSALLFFPAIMLVALNGLWMGLMLGVLCSRFRDIPQIVSNVMQVAFFLTPVIWHPDVLKGRHWAIDYNPFYYLLEVMRTPLMGGSRALYEVFGMSAMITLFGMAITFVFFARFRSRIAYWV